MKTRRTRQPRSDLTGHRFGKLTVQRWAFHSQWLCMCDCGRESLVLTSNLNRGNTTSCGCVKRIVASKRATTHGLSRTLAYKTWLGIRARCLRPSHPSYSDYGGKGIGIWDEWAVSAERFIADVGQPPTLGHSLDRIDNSKGYEPGNVRWATDVEQANNKSNNRVVEWRGAKYTIAQLARKIAAECNINHAFFYEALRREIGQAEKHRGKTELDQ
jgi:hypothetical protein